MWIDVESEELEKMWLLNSSIFGNGIKIVSKRWKKTQQY